MADEISGEAQNVANGKTVTLSSSYSGADVGNYAITDQTTTTANVTPKALSVSGITAADKTYDGTTNATLTLGNLIGLITGESLNLSGIGNFDNPNVGTGKTVLAELFLANGANGLASNYTISNATTTASINAVSNPVPPIPPTIPPAPPAPPSVPDPVPSATPPDASGSSGSGIISSDTSIGGGNSSSGTNITSGSSSGIETSSSGPSSASSDGPSSSTSGPSSGRDTSSDSAPNAGSDVSSSSNSSSASPEGSSRGNSSLGDNTTSDSGSSSSSSSGANSGKDASGNTANTTGGVLSSDSSSSSSSASGSDTSSNSGESSRSGSGTSSGSGSVSSGESTDGSSPGSGGDTTGSNRGAASAGSAETGSGSVITEPRDNEQIIVTFVKQPTETVTGAILVEAPGRFVRTSTGFSFPLPKDLIELTSSTRSQPEAMLINGKPLPHWLRFVPADSMFVAKDIPNGGLPIQVVIKVGRTRTLLLVTERND